VCHCRVGSVDASIALLTEQWHTNLSFVPFPIEIHMSKSSTAVSARGMGDASARMGITRSVSGAGGTAKEAKDAKGETKIML